MMELRQYIADAFTDCLFSGNQAAVCLPQAPLDATLMQKIAIENNFSETAFAVRTETGYDLRWFTPGGEIDLCGHATLGTAFVIMTQVDSGCQKIDFSTRSGILTVERNGNLFKMNFPQVHYKKIEVTDDMAKAIGVRPVEVYLGRDLMMVLPSEEDVRNLMPDQTLLKELPGLIQAVTARGKEYDCVSRIFAPRLDVPEDPVTGSTHCMIAPYWAKVLDKAVINAFQASRRGGKLICEIMPDNRIDISGHCVLYSEATLYI